MHRVPKPTEHGARESNLRISNPQASPSGNLPVKKFQPFLPTSPSNKIHGPDNTQSFSFACLLELSPSLLHLLQTCEYHQSISSPPHHHTHIHNGCRTHVRPKDGLPYGLNLRKGRSPSSPHRCQGSFQWLSTGFLWYVPIGISWSFLKLQSHFWGITNLSYKLRAPLSSSSNSISHDPQPQIFTTPISIFNTNIDFFQVSPPPSAAKLAAAPPSPL